MNPCPNCGSLEAKVVMTCRRANGNRYRRYECTACTSRWSHSFPEGEPRPRPRTPGRANYESRRMTAREAASLILSFDSCHELARKTGFSYGTIQAIKTGRSYQDVWALLQPLLDED